MYFLHAFLIALIKKKYVLLTCLKNTLFLYVICKKFLTNLFPKEKEKELLPSHSLPVKYFITKKFNHNKIKTCAFSAPNWSATYIQWRCWRVFNIVLSIFPNFYSSPPRLDVSPSFSSFPFLYVSLLWFTFVFGRYFSSKNKKIKSYFLSLFVILVLFYGNYGFSEIN